MISPFFYFKMHSFYSPDFNLNAKQLRLNKEESKHCVKVLRLGIGDIVELQNGQGGIATAKILIDDPKSCELVVLEVVQKEQTISPIHIAIAPTKSIDRFEWFLEKATELGVNEITPILCSHSERKVIKHDRLEKVLIAAMKQSHRSFVPKLNPLTTYKSFLTNKLTEEALYIAHCMSSTQPLLHLKNMDTNNKSALVLIGPEGDFSKEEVEMAIETGFKPVSLGKNRLRTETAGIAACHILALGQKDS